MTPTKIAFTKKYFPEQYHGEDYFIEYILEEGENILDAFKKAKEETLQCFKNNNPQIQWHDEVIQTRREQLQSTPEFDKKVKQTFAETAFHALDIDVNNMPPLQKEEQIDPSFNLINDINKSTTLKEIDSYKYLLKTQDEKKAFKEKRWELETKFLDTQRKPQLP